MKTGVSVLPFFFRDSRQSGEAWEKSGYGTFLPRANAAACPHPAQGDMRALASGGRF
jgi:hypothetical protein